MWPDLPKPIIIGHRGSPAQAPENTLASFDMAAKLGADAIEFDVKLSSDGHIVVHHDSTVNRTTDGRGKVSHLSFAALRDLDAGSWFSKQFRGEKIPALDEVCEVFGARLYLNIELTNYSTPSDDLVPRVVEVVKKHNLQDRVLFSSFFPRNLVNARSLLPNSLFGLLAWPGFNGWWARVIGIRSDVYQALNPYVSDITQGLVYRVQAAGKCVNAWTVNVGNEMKRMVGLGVDAIFTDDVEWAFGQLRRK